MLYFSLMVFARSPLARMLAILFVEYAITNGWIPASEKTEAVEDAVTVIGYAAMFLTLLIWQWRVHHPAKVQLDAEMPMTEEGQLQATRSLNALTGVIKKIFTTPERSPEK